MANPPYIIDATQENFRDLVLGNSRRGPVFVNYWSPGAGPCLKFWPVLEKLANEYAGKFLLVNLNTDKLGQLAKETGVTSIPTVKVFLHEHPVDTIHGAQSESEFRKLINKYVARDSDAVLLTAVMRYEQGNVDESVDMMQRAAEVDPDNPRIPIAQAKLLIKDGDYAAAEKILHSMPKPMQQSQEVSALLIHIGVLLAAQQEPDSASLELRIGKDSSDLSARYALAAHHLLKDDYESALAQLAEILRIDVSYHEQVALRTMRNVLQMLQQDDELHQRYYAVMQSIIN